MDMERRIIAYSGAHGTGKTTAVYRHATDLKMRQTGSVGVILETARMCPYPILSARNDKPSMDAQIWIFSRQMQEEMRAAQIYDVVVSDRTILDCIAYTAAAGMHELAFAMREVARHYAPMAYQCVYFMSVVDHDYCVDDGFRSQDLEFRREVEWALLSLYDEMGIEVKFDGHR